MHVSVYLPPLLSALFGLAAPAVGRRLPPDVATWLLSVGSLLAAAASTASLALLGMTVVGQSPLLAARGHWSGAALRHADPVSTPIAVVATAVLLALAARFTAAGARRLRALRDAGRLAAALPAAGGELAVVDDPSPHACAVPGRPGRIVVSTGLLRGLDAAERRAVLAHERAHLMHRHHLHQTVARLATAANPLLGRLPAAVAFAAERWADEEAAATVRRDIVADALTHVFADGMRPAAPAVPAVVLAAVTTQVATRVRALREPAPRLTLWRVALLLVLLAVIAAALLDAAHDTDRLFDLAQYSYRISLR
jgi:Zn-dependent protease with chaperone function